MNKLPELNSRKIRQAITKIESLILSDVNDTEIDEILGDLFNGYQVEVPIISDPVTLYRARKFSSIPENISALGPPPAHAVTSYGRGNSIGESMFYGANSKDVPFYELKCEIGDKIVISSWRTKSDMVLNHIGFTEETKNRLNSIRNFDQIYQFVKNTNNYNILNEMVHEYLGFLFSQPVDIDTNPNGYKLTSAIARKLIQSDIINGVMYPTIQMFGNADNILLKNEYYETNLEFINAEFIEISDIDESKYSGKVLNSTSSYDDSGILSWSGRPLQWVLTGNQIVKFEAHGGQWVLKDIEDNVIDPI